MFLLKPTTENALRPKRDLLICIMYLCFGSGSNTNRPIFVYHTAILFHKLCFTNISNPLLFAKTYIIYQPRRSNRNASQNFGGSALRYNFYLLPSLRNKSITS